MQGPMVTVPTRIVANGTPHTLTLDPRSSLLDVLREQLALTGPKRAATTVSAVPAPCISMGGASRRA